MPRFVAKPAASGAALLAALVLVGRLPEARADRPAPVHAAVASDNEQSSRTALETIAQGGSVVDAAVAAAFMLNVTASMSCGIGGGGFALVYDATEKKVSVFDFRETAPAVYDETLFRSAAHGTKVGVPGEVSGLVELHRRWGKRSLADDIAPTVKAADQGFPLSAHLAKGIATFTDRITAAPGLGPIFLPGGAPPHEKDLLRNQALSRTLARIGSEGAKAFYFGPVASEVASVVRAAGGTMTEQDLASYRTVERAPLRGSWDGYDVAAMPPPSAGGIMLLETLGMFSKAELVAMGQQTAVFQHMLAEAMRGALADRMHTVGDPAFTPDKSAALLSPAALSARKSKIAYDRTHAPARFELEEHGTTHFVVADEKGNIVSLTTTINAPFGASVYAPVSGVLLNNELEDFTPRELAQRFGFTNGGPNAPRPGARPASSMTPVVVFHDGAPVLAAGGSGGLRIANNVTEAILYRLAFGKGAKDAVAAPRFFTPPNGPIIAYGPGESPSAAVALGLAEVGEQVKSLPWDETAVQMITLDAHDKEVSLQAGADPRKGGSGIVQ